MSQRDYNRALDSYIIDDGEQLGGKERNHTAIVTSETIVNDISYCTYIEM